MAKKLLVLLVALLCLGSLVASFIVRKNTTDIASYSCEFFGVGEPITLRSVLEELDIQRCLETVKSLGVKRLREWVWMSAFLTGPSSLDQTFKETLDLVISEMSASNISIMGMSHDFPSWMTGIINDLQAVPQRNMSAESDYMRFLVIYRESWKTLTASFPDITMWEIGNEFNTDPFLHPQGYKADNPFSPRFSPQEKVDITTDLLYYGSLGIHEGNPNAKTVLGGLAPYPNIYGVANFLEMIYKNIESGRWPSTDSNDFFEVVCWHPYLANEQPTISNWVNPNKAVYEVMRVYGDWNKLVVFSEIGYSDIFVSGEVLSEYLLDTFQLARDNFPWLVTIYWFRLIEPYVATISSINPAGYGLIWMNWEWKIVAYAYNSLIKIATDRSQNCKT